MSPAPRLSRSASGLRHLRWSREVLATLEAHAEHNPTLSEAEREVLRDETRALAAAVQALSAAVKPYRDFLERTRVRYRGQLRVAELLSRASDEDSARARLDEAREQLKAVETTQRQPLKAALSAAIDRVREELARMDERLARRFSPDLVESLYPPLVRDASMVADDSDPDDDATDSTTPITPEVHAEARLVIGSRMAGVGVFAVSAAHELNSPIAFVVATIDAAIRRLGLLDQRSSSRHGSSWGRGYADSRSASIELNEALHLLEEARESAERARLIARDLDGLLRGEVSARRSLVLSRVLDACARLAESQLHARVVCDLDEAPPVEADGSRLAALFLELLFYATRSTPEQPANRSEIHVALRPGTTAGWALVEVSGPDQDAAPTHLIDPPRSSPGLSGCKELVAELGGRIEVESRPGARSTVRIALPVARTELAGDQDLAAKGVGAAPTSGVPAAPPRRRVLIIDDEPLLVRAIAGTLEPEHETVTAPGAREALARISAGERYDVILCDLMMPDMTGMELYESLAETAPEQQRRMVFLTGGAFTERGRVFLEQVNARLLVKPFDAGTLLSLIAEVVSSS